MIKAATGLEKEVAGKLHGNGAGAGDNATRLRILEHGADHTNGIDTGIIIKRSIFGGDYRIDQMGRHLINRYPRPAAFFE